MRAALLIARNDLRLFLREKAHYFWLFGSPLLFAFFMGFAMRGPSGPSTPSPQIVVENRDSGFLSKWMLDELTQQGINFSTNSSEKSDRRLVIPENFSTNLLQKIPIKLKITHEGGRVEAQSLVDLKLFRTLLAFNAHLIEAVSWNPELSASGWAQVVAKIDPVQLKTEWGTRKKMPAGFQQSLPGVMTMFIMMNLLIFGGSTLASERKEGVLRRLLATRLSLGELVLGKIAGLMLLGLVQILILLAAGKFFMKVNFENSLPLLLVTLLVYCWAAGAIGILVGSMLSADKVVAVCVLGSMTMAALGGCWWPLEIVSENVRLLGHIFPTAWAMDALHQLISFGGNFEDIARPLLVLVGFATGATVLSVKFFKA